jgi:hypothetical protein
MVLDSAETDFKDSARELLGEVDGFVWREAGRDAPRRFPPPAADHKPGYRSLLEGIDSALAAAVAGVLESAL